MKINTFVILLLLICTYVLNISAGPNILKSSPNVYIINKYKLAGCNLFWDSNFIYDLKKKSYIAFYDKPGKHALETKTYDGKKGLSFEIRPDSVYYIMLLRTKYGDRLTPQITNAQKTQKIISGLKFISIDLENTIKQKDGKLHINPFVRLLLIIGLIIIFYAILFYSRGWYYMKNPQGNDFVFYLYFILGIVCLGIFCLIPFIYVKNWLPGGLNFFHIFFVSVNALFYVILLKAFKKTPFKEFLSSFFLLFLILYYILFVLLRLTNHFRPEWINRFIALGTWKELLLSSWILFALVLNGVLIRKMGESRDLSGAYEKSNKAYWAAKDGKFYMSANKMQSGEWVPPLSAFKRYLLLNLVFVIVLAIIVNIVSLKWLNIFSIYFAMLVISTILFCAIAANRKR